VIREARASVVSRFQLHPTSLSTEPLFDVLAADWTVVAVANNTFKEWDHALEAIRNQLRIDVHEREWNDAANAVTGRTRFSPTASRRALDQKGLGWRQRWDSGRDPDHIACRGTYYYWQGRDHDVALGVVNRGHSSAPARNVSFGLPIPYPTVSSTSSVRGMTVVNVRGDDPETPLRRPSTLAFTVRRWDANDYRVVLVLMKSRFLPPRHTVEAQWKHRGTKHRCRYPYVDDWSDLEAFVSAAASTRVTLP